jgi:type II secretory pathway component PulK
MKRRAISEQGGVALIMVIVMIAVTSALLMSLTDSTYISMRLNRAAERRVQAEYLLKSAVHLAQALIMSDTTPHDSREEDAWMFFEQGREVPGELIGLSEPNLRITLQISSENSKIPVLSVLTGNTVDPAWRDILVALFRNLGFDDTRPSPEDGDDSSQPLPDSAKMVANLIDYLDTDESNYSPNDGFTAQGYEETLPPNESLRNEQIIESPSQELRSIPGFTADRVRRLLPYISIRSRSNVNINGASVEVLRAMIAGLDPMADLGYAERLTACREVAEQGPFKNINNDIIRCINDASVAARLSPKLKSQGDTFYVLAKVEYGTGIGTSSFLSRAHLKNTGGKGRLPAIESMLTY